jgi:hypothetical protein
LATPMDELEKFKVWYLKEKVKVGKIGLREVKKKQIYSIQAIQHMQKDKEACTKLTEFIRNQKRDRSNRKQYYVAKR